MFINNNILHVSVLSFSGWCWYTYPLTKALLYTRHFKHHSIEVTADHRFSYFKISLLGKGGENLANLLTVFDSSEAAKRAASAPSIIAKNRNIGHPLFRKATEQQACN